MAYNTLGQRTQIARFQSTGTANPVATTDFTYDTANRLVRRHDAVVLSYTPVTYWVYDEGTNPVLEYFGGNPLIQHRYLWSDKVDDLLADEQNPGLSSRNTLWALSDHLGSIRDIADTSESTGTTSIANHRRYDSFGRRVWETNDAVDLVFGYTGKLFDETTRLQNNLNRWYDSSTGRWISQDPIGFAAGDANLYRYVGNGPNNATDPSGLIAPVIAYGIYVGALAGANYFFWSKNAESVDDLINNRPIQHNNTPYSGQYWVGAGKSTAGGAAAGGTLAAAPVLIPYAGTLGVACEAPQVIHDYRNGNYVSGSFHLGMGGLAGYGGFRGGRPAIRNSQEPPSGVMVAEESPFGMTIIVDEGLANTPGYLTQSIVFPPTRPLGAQGTNGPFVHGLQNNGDLGSILWFNSLSGGAPRPGGLFPGPKAHDCSLDAAAHSTKILIEFATDVQPDRSRGWLMWPWRGEGTVPNTHSIPIRPLRIRMPDGTIIPIDD
jgi:RHS repeat-associated protein